MTEDHKPLTKKRIMSIKSPENKAKAFVELTRKQESEDKLFSRRLEINESRINELVNRIELFERNVAGLLEKSKYNEERIDTFSRKPINEYRFKRLEEQLKQFQGTQELWQQTIKDINHRCFGSFILRLFGK